VVDLNTTFLFESKTVTDAPLIAESNESNTLF